MSLAGMDLGPKMTGYWTAVYIKGSKTSKKGVLTFFLALYMPEEKPGTLSSLLDRRRRFKAHFSEDSRR